MNPRRSAPLAVLLIAFSVTQLGAGCTSRSPKPEPAPAAPGLSDIQAGPSVVLGTVIDASSGNPVAGARVIGPEGSETVSDAAGRFRLKGMATGTQGELRAIAGPLEGVVRLRPLAGGRLEVVVYVH